MSSSSRYASRATDRATENAHELNISRSRVKSALGRLNTPPREQVLPEFRSVRRAQSANSARGMMSSLQSRTMESGHSHPPATHNQSMYEDHTSELFSPRASLRPHSPTRRNNPHPTKGFMAWRVPSSTENAAENDVLVRTARLLRRDSQERFYHDYQGTGKPPAEQESILTRLANAPPPMPDSSSALYGKHDASYFSSRRPSLQGISGGSGGGAKPQMTKSRHLSSGAAQPQPQHHSRSLSESDAAFIKSSLKHGSSRTRTTTEPLQHSLWREPEIWHHRSVRDPQPQVIHRTSVFAAPKTNRGMHFTIHPEWPDND